MKYLCPNQGSVAGWGHGEGGGKGVDVVVSDEELAVGAGQDDYFWSAGAVDVGGEGGHEGAEVGGELAVPEVDGWVVDADADYFGSQGRDG